MLKQVASARDQADAAKEDYWEAQRKRKILLCASPKEAFIGAAPVVLVVRDSSFLNHKPDKIIQLAD